MSLHRFPRYYPPAPGAFMSTDLPHLAPGIPALSGVFRPGALAAAVTRVREPLHVVREGPAGRLGVGFGGQTAPTAGYPLLGTLPALYPMARRSFVLRNHGVRFPYVVGEMRARSPPTHGDRHGACRNDGFFGAGGLAPAQVGKALDEIEARLARTGRPGAQPHPFAHSPSWKCDR